MCQTHRPLAGRTALVACSEMKSETVAAGLRALGAHVVTLPVISIRPLADNAALDAALGNLAAYAWVIFTSGYGVQFFLQRMAEKSLPIGLCGDLRICAVGPATAALLEAAGLEVALVPADFVAEGVLQALAEKLGGLVNLRGLRVLLPRAKEARDVLPQALQSAGARVDVVPCYENTLPQVSPERLHSVLAQSPDLLVFTSSSSVRNFVTIIGSVRGGKLLSDTTTAVLGPVTAQTLSSYGKEADILPKENTIASLIEAISRHYQTADFRPPASDLGPQKTEPERQDPDSENGG